VRRALGGFTFIEVISCLLVLSLGIAATVSLTYYAMILSSGAQAKATGMATALTVAIDPAPLMHTSSQAQWQGGSAGIAVTGVGTTTGWLNGYYVVRVEAAGTTPDAGFSNDPVSVDVYDGVRGRLVASYTTWVMRQSFSP
jgi:hypothetical protein